MKTLSNIVEGMFTSGVHEGMFDIDDIVDRGFIESKFDDHWERNRQKVITSIEGDTIIFDFSKHSSNYNRLELSIFDEIDCKKEGFKKIIVKDEGGSGSLTTMVYGGEKMLDGKKNFVQEIHFEFNGVTEFTDEFALQVKNIKIYCEKAGGERTTLIPKNFEGCEFYCETAVVDFAGDDRLKFDIDCENLLIIHDAKKEDWPVWPELTNMELVMVRNKSYKTTVENMWGLRIHPKDKFWINFPGRTGAQVFNEFIKNHFSKLKYKKFKIDFCHAWGYGDHWHEYIDCNGRTWSCVYYGRW